LVLRRRFARQTPWGLDHQANCGAETRCTPYATVPEAPGYCANLSGEVYYIYEGNVERSAATRHLKDMAMSVSMRYMRVLLLAFFVCSSFTSPDRFTLCTGTDGEACTEPLGAAYGIFAAKDGHRCDSSEGCDMGTTHRHHRPCTDPPFTANLGHIPDHERLTGPQCLPVSSLPVRVVDSYPVHGVDRTVSSESALALFHLSSLQDIRSVVLLI
jgi:hypothetical protein